MILSESTCTGPTCHAPVLWGVTLLGKRLSLDPEPAADGNVVLVDDRGKVRLRVLSGSELPWDGTPSADGGPWRPHAQRCPDAWWFRGRRDTDPRPRCRVCTKRMGRPGHARDLELVNAGDLDGIPWDTHPGCDPRPAADAARAVVRRARAGDPSPEQESLL